MEQNNVNDVLLVKYLLGEVSETELSRIQQWLKESSDNKAQFYELKLVWEQSRNALVSSTIDVEDAWARFRQRIAQKKVPLPVNNYKWLKIAAAMLVLLVSGSLVWFMTSQQEPVNTIAQQVQPPAVTVDTEAPKANIAAVPADTGSQGEVDPVTIERPASSHNKPLRFVVTKKHTVKEDLVRSINNYGNKKYICNGTPCPLEICISQSLRCLDKSSSAFSTCSTLEPDQSGQLSLKGSDKIAKNCSLTIQEIRITRPITGESIVLDEHSSPATAQDLYNYITGQKTGNILAGVFHSGCDNEDDDHLLKFDNNNYGHLILQ